MQYIYHEPTEYGFRDHDGHHGKFFGTGSPKTDHLIIECDDKLTVSHVERECEFNYYILAGDGYFTFNDNQQAVRQGDMVVIPPGTKHSFGGKLKMLLINTPHWSKGQEEVIQDV